MTTDERTPVNDPDQEAADRLAFGMWLQGHRLDADQPAETPEEPPGPRAPRPDPSQALGVNATAANAAESFAQALHQPARGDSGWHPLH